MLKGEHHTRKSRQRLARLAETRWADPNFKSRVSKSMKKGALARWEKARNRPKTAKNPASRGHK